MSSPPALSAAAAATLASLRAEPTVENKQKAAPCLVFCRAVPACAKLDQEESMSTEEWARLSRTLDFIMQQPTGALQLLISRLMARLYSY